MFIDKIIIKNYKSISELTINCDPKFNVIIGENNIGKSTIFEALLLWKQCFDRSILVKGDRFYKPSNNKYILFNELDFLRVTKDTDLFHNPEKNIKITLLINHNDIIYCLGFEIERSKKPADSYFRIRYINYDDFNRLSEAITDKLRESIFIHKTQPISNVPSREPFMTTGQVLKKISRGKSYEVLRNKIIKSSSITEAVSKDISNVLNEEVRLKLSNKRSDEYIDLSVTINEDTTELHLQGSGFLQIAEIFSSIEYFESALNIVLLDEPDSHIHTKLQNNLITILKEDSENNQIFIISHNDNFVDNFQEEGSLYFLNKGVKEETNILNPIELSSRNLIKQELGSVISSLEMLNTVENIIFVEGSGDKEFWSNLIDKYLEINGIPKPNISFIHLRGKDNLKVKVENLLQIFPQIIDLKKVSVIFDKDFSTRKILEKQVQELKKAIRKHNGFVDAPDGYCLESTLFSEPLLFIKHLNSVTKIDNERIAEFLNCFISNLSGDLKNVTTARYSDLKKRFISQKHNREELKSEEFDDVIKDILSSGPHHMISKNIANEFFTSFESDFLSSENNVLTGKTSTDFLNIYISNIRKIDDIYPTHINIIRQILNEPV